MYKADLRILEHVESDFNPNAIQLFKDIDSELTAFEFFKSVGTHVIEKAEFGAAQITTIIAKTASNYTSVEEFRKTIKNSGFELFGFGSKK